MKPELRVGRTKKSMLKLTQWLLIPKIISVKNARAWVSMISYLKNK